MENLRWIAAAALSAYACSLAVHHTTPIDLALPFLAIAVTLLAWLSYSEVLLGVPVLVVAEIAVPDERLRLLVFGAVGATGVAIAVNVGRGFSPPPPGEGGLKPRPTLDGAPIVALIALLLLRWIPLGHVRYGRELLLLAIAAAIVFVLGRTPFAVTVAVVVSLVTTAVPLRTLAFPLAVLLIAAAARTFGMPALRLVWPSTVVLAFVMLFFPWSGIVARAFPYFLQRAAPEKPRTLVRQALAPRQGETYWVPEGATHLIVSGANVAHLRRGAILGRMEPGAVDIRIGDVADWGYARREAWHKAHNPLPRDAAGEVRDYGYEAWIDGAGRIPLPRGARLIRVTADGALPPHVSLQVEGFE
ncbi:MAG TPA: hypothetical protein VF432_28065 [Thermoanaerobaculia bacterium]